MCGIAGIFHFDKLRPVDSQLLRVMTNKLFHRGPDGEGYYVKNNMGLGHRRLVIIDQETGDQPMFNQDESISIVFNGEIYNYIELRKELRALGHNFVTHSDTEVIIKAYEEWGIDCQKRLNGMWAFAIWNNRTQELFISRDRVGEKPLFYSIIDNSIVFASEIKAVKAYGIPNQFNFEILELYMMLGYIPAPYTFFKNINKLEPGHCILVSENNCKISKYWELPQLSEKDMLNDEKSVHKRFEELFTDSVRIRLRSDVPFGAFLSGGLDSSCIVATMSELHPMPVNTFNIGFSEKGFDESALAQLVADKFHTTHSTKTVTPHSFNSDLNNIVNYYDEPFGDSSAIPTGYVSEFAVDKVKMVLTGDGGDELLSGYTGYQGEKFAHAYNKIPNFIAGSLPKLLSSISQPLSNHYKYKMNRRVRVLYSSLQPFTTRIAQKGCWGDFDSINRLVQNSGSYYPIVDYLNDLLKSCSFTDGFYKLMFLNYKLSLPDDMLVKVDRMSMSHSLETRTPFLDYRLIEFMAGVHKDLKMKGYERKSVLRNTIAKKLPKELLSAPKKGFVVPLLEWFKTKEFEPVLNQLVLSENLPFSRGELIGIVRKHQSGKENNGNLLWMLFVLDKVIGNDK